MSVGGAQADVANAFHLVDLIAVHAPFPVPVAVSRRFNRILVKLNRPREFRKGSLFADVRRIPLDRRPHRELVGLFRRARLVVFRLRFPAHTVIRARKIDDRRVQSANVLPKKRIGRSVSIFVPQTLLMWRAPPRTSTSAASTRTPR